MKTFLFAFFTGVPSERVFWPREIHQILRSAIGTLPKEQREAVALHYVQGLRIADIAILSDAPAGTIKARLHRARDSLRKTLFSKIEGARSGKIF